MKKIVKKCNGPSGDRTRDGKFQLLFTFEILSKSQVKTAVRTQPKIMVSETKNLQTKIILGST